MQPINLEATLERKFIPTTGGRRYLRIIVRASAGAAPTNRKPLNLAFVLDRSGSMSGAKLRLVKEAVTFGIARLSPSDRAALVVFDDQIDVLEAGTGLDQPTKQRLMASLERLDAGGSTALGEGWLTGCRLIAREAASAGERYVNRALLLSDGLANVGITDPVELTTHARELRQRGVTTSTFGVGRDFDKRLMSQLAEAAGGAFYFMEHPRQIPDFFAGELGELLSVVAERVTLSLNVPSHVSAELLNDFPLERRGTCWTIAGGNLSSGEERTFLIELTGASGTLGEELPLELRLHFHDPSARVDREDATRVALRYATPVEAGAEQRDGAILELAGQLQAARAKREALEEIYAGRYDGARERINAAIGALSAPAMAPAAAALAGAVTELRQLAEDAPDGWGAIARKQALYSSQITSRGRRDYGKSA